MLILGINTVADACEAALVRDGVLAAELSEPMNQGHDARLAPVVERLMREAGVAFADLDRVAIVAVAYTHLTPPTKLDAYSLDVAVVC